MSGGEFQKYISNCDTSTAERWHERARGGENQTNQGANIFRPSLRRRRRRLAMMLDAHLFGMAERLRNHNGYLDSLIEMVPAKYYFPPDPDEMVKKFQKHVNKPATQTAADKLQRKMESSERKRAKLDPEQLTVPQQQQHNAEQEEQERVRDRSQQRRRSQQGGDSEGEDEDEAPGPVSAALSGYNTGDVSTVSELKARLQQKLEKLRNGRGGAPKSSEERERELTVPCTERAREDSQ